jgi:hypothetical protein
MGSMCRQMNGSPTAKTSTQRIWLLEEKLPGDAASLRPVLQKLAEQPSEGILLLGSSPANREHIEQMSGREPDVVVIHEATWPEGRALNEIGEVNAGFLIVASSSRADRFEFLAQRHSVSFVPANAESESIGLALRGLAFARLRETEWQAQVTALQHRLNDRILIERAKGILVQKLGITEEEAYKRLRLSSRRQRRQIRDIAQSLLDTQALLSPEGSSTAESAEAGISSRAGLGNGIGNY